MNADAVSMELLIELGKEALMKKQLREQRKLVKQLQKSAAVPAPEPEVVPEPAPEAPAPAPQANGGAGSEQRPKNNFQCDDFQQMVLSGVLAEGTIVFGKRKSAVYKAVVKILTKTGGAREAFLVSEANSEFFNWQGCITSSPSAFRKVVWNHETPSNPPKKSKGNGWTWLRVGSETGPFLETLRRNWKGLSEEVVVEDNE